MYIRILGTQYTRSRRRCPRRTTNGENGSALPGGENLTTIPAGRVLVFVESRGAAAGVGRANHCTSTGGPHWASRAEMAKMADAALVLRPLTPERSTFRERRRLMARKRAAQRWYGPQDRH